MNGNNGLSGLVVGRKPVKCQKCKSRLCYVGVGKYRCPMCGAEEYDDIGKIKKFLDDNGPAPPVVISQATGVASDVVEAFKEKRFITSPQVKLLGMERNDEIKKPKIIKEETKNYHLKCARCGDGIASGRYCVTCVKELAGGLQTVFKKDMAKREREESMDGSMHFVGKRENRFL